MLFGGNLTEWNFSTAKTRVFQKAIEIGLLWGISFFKIACPPFFFFFFFHL
jgi:hypothetical protein